MRKSPIIRICQGQPNLSVVISQHGCDGGQVINHEDIRLAIFAPHCKHVLKSPWQLCGCWPQHRHMAVPNQYWDEACGCLDYLRIPPHEIPVLIYPAFDTDDEGAVVFWFDDELWKRPPGRWIGEVQTRSGHVLVTLDLDLCTVPFITDKVSITSETC